MRFVLFVAGTRFTIGAKTFCLASQRLSPGDPWLDEGVFIRSGWDGPTGEFTSCDTYAVRAWDYCLRIDIIPDPLGAARRNLPSSPEALAEVAANTDPFIQQAALEQIGNLGASALPALPALLKQMKSGDVSPQQAITAICRAAPEPAAPLIAEAAASGAVTARCDIITILADVGPPARSAAPVLTRLIFDPEPLVVLGSAYALTKLGPPPLEAADPVIRLMASTDAEIRASAIMLVGDLGATNANLEAALIRLLDDPDARINGMAARSLAATRRAKHATNHVDEVAAARLETMARAQNLQSHWAIDALSTIGPRGGKALASLFEDSNRLNLYAVSEAMKRLGPMAADQLDVLLRCLNDGDDTGRDAKAAEIIGYLGAAASNAVPDLTTALEHRHLHTRLQSARSLWRITERTNDIWPTIISALAQRDEGRNKVLAAEIVTLIGPPGASAKPHLVEMLPANGTMCGARLKPHWRASVDHHKDVKVGFCYEETLAYAAGADSCTPGSKILCAIHEPSLPTHYVQVSTCGAARHSC